MQRQRIAGQRGAAMTTAAWASTALPPPPVWDTVPQYPDGACLRCAHSRPCSTALGCACPDVAGRGQPVPVAVARQQGGACGIEARHHLYHPARA